MNGQLKRMKDKHKTNKIQTKDTYKTNKRRIKDKSTTNNGHIKTNESEHTTHAIQVNNMKTPRRQIKDNRN